MTQPAGIQPAGGGQLQNLNGAFPYKKVTITSGAGFLGRFVTEKLKDGLVRSIDW